MQEFACVFSLDIEEGRLAELLLRERYPHTKLLPNYDAEEAKNASLLVFDTDSVLPPNDLMQRVITFGRTERANNPYTFLLRPYSVPTMRALIGSSKRPMATGFFLLNKERAVEVGGKHIPLTKQEHALLPRLYEANGETVSRAELLKTLFPDRTEDSLNVYIHYLRKKLERGGRRFIFSHRGEGYALILGEKSVAIAD